MENRTFAQKNFLRGYFEQIKTVLRATVVITSGMKVNQTDAWFLKL